MAGISFIYQKPPGVSDSIFRYLQGQGLATLQRVTPVDTGNLQNGWYIKQLAPDMIEFANDVDYAEYVNDGTPKMAPRDMTGRAIAAFDGYISAQQRNASVPLMSLAKLYPR